MSEGSGQTATMRWMYAALLVGMGPLVACGDDGALSPGSCGDITEETLDANSTHLLPGAEIPEYLTDPPTSGPHLASRPSNGVLSEPIAPEQQVSTIEVGITIFQHDGLSPAELDALEALGGRTTAVAPRPGLDDRVVATAWGLTMRCDGVDPDALAEFNEYAATNTAALAHGGDE